MSNSLEESKVCQCTDKVSQSQGTLTSIHLLIPPKWACFALCITCRSLDDTCNLQIVGHHILRWMFLIVFWMFLNVSILCVVEISTLQCITSWVHSLQLQKCALLQMLTDRRFGNIELKPKWKFHYETEIESTDQPPRKAYRLPVSLSDSFLISKIQFTKFANQAHCLDNWNLNVSEWSVLSRSFLKSLLRTSKFISIWWSLLDIYQSAWKAEVDCLQLSWLPFRRIIRHSVICDFCISFETFD